MLRPLFGAVRPMVHLWWRARRGGTLGARAVVRDGAGGVLLVEHTYMAGWHLPGGGVEAGETAEQAIVRELAEEAAVAPLSRPALFGIYANFLAMPRDHVALYVVERWRPLARRRCLEIRAAEFFAPAALPATTTPGTRRRLAEVLDGAEADGRW
jgi:ADP-ribose pyrophosphatase YjhB (NUDIX family)